MPRLSKHGLDFPVVLGMDRLTPTECDRASSKRYGRLCVHTRGPQVHPGPTLRLLSPVRQVRDDLAAPDKITK